MSSSLSFSPHEQSLRTRTIPIQNGQIQTISNLDPCLSYFVRVSAVNCGSRVTSDPMLLDLKDSAPFSMTLSVPVNLGTCNAWVASIGDRGIADIHNSLNSTSIARCGTIAPCFSESTLTCSETDNSKAVFKLVA
jgi:hypothetical protein